MGNGRTAYLITLMNIREKAQACERPLKYKKL